MNKLTMRTKIVVCALAVVVLTGIIIAFFILGKGSKEQEVYRENLVKRGDLIVGITKSGLADFGLVEQSFTEDLDFLHSIELVVEQACVSEGQTIQAKDALYLLEADGIDKLRNMLETDMEAAQKELELVQAQTDASRTSAQYTYDSNVAYGVYAEEEYNSTIRTLEAAITDAEQKLSDANGILSTYQEQLRIVNSDYTTASRVLKECEKSRDKTDRTNNTYLYVEYFQLAEEAENNLAVLEEKKVQLEKDVAQAKQNVEDYTEQLEDAQRELKIQRLNAQETKELRKLAYDTAQKTYDVTVEYWEETVKRQEAEYTKAKERWDIFNAYFDENALITPVGGVLCQVCLASGDSLGNDVEPVILYNVEEVTMTACLEFGEIADVSVGSRAEVRFDAHPGRVFEAEVTQMTGRRDEQVSGGDNSIIYDVVLALQGDVSGVLQGMTGEITFIRKEKADVLYVSNHAVWREGAFSYVTVKDEAGNWFEQQVVTGFSDGVNVEILHGLSEKDVVCYTVRDKNEDIPVKKRGRIKTEEGQQLVYATLEDVKGNEITYIVTSTVSGGDAQVVQAVEEAVTALIPVGVISDFSKLERGDEIALVLEQTEEQNVITAVYLTE